MLQPAGPVGGVALVPDLVLGEPLAEPTLAFTTDDRRAIAIVGLGADVPDGSKLTVTWFRLTGVDGREQLFVHEIPVGPGGFAYSEGVAAGGLAPGIYETVAALDEHRVRTPWIVRIVGGGGDAVGPNAAPAALGRPELDIEPAVLHQLGDEDWNVPDAGDSGWYEPEQPTAEPSGPGPCELLNVGTDFTPLLDVNGSIGWLGACSVVTLAASVSGPPQTVASSNSAASEAPLPWLHGAANVCGLPGGRDFPGTVVQWTATAAEGPTAAGSYTLPDFGETLSALVQSVPDPGSKVEPGDRIELRAFAMVLPPALGVDKLTLEANGQVVDEVPNASGTSSPEPCDFGRFGAISRTAYVVPQDPPDVITICGIARGFDGNEDRQCIEFFTADVWTGTYAGTVTWDCGPLGERSGTLEGAFTILVDADGTATMDVSHTVTGSCAGPGGSLDTPITMTGERTPSGFSFPAFLGLSGTMTITVSGETGTGTFTAPAPGPATIDITLEVECTSCGTPNA